MSNAELIERLAEALRLASSTRGRRLKLEESRLIHSALEAYEAHKAAQQ